ncbi:MAG: hypothetical protein IJR97_12705 [Clostridia bacterium]|nr:hypothetical protein [Clostridia bacterium]
MNDILNNLEKLVKAGFGAASEGLDQAAKVVDKFAEKGEPAYNQAKEAVSGVMDSLKKTFTEPDPTEIEQIKALLRRFPREALTEIEQLIAELKAEAPEESGNASDTPEAQPQESGDDRANG